MFRRNRPFRSDIPPARAAFEQEIRQAHELFERGEHAQAAEIFERLASLAAARRGPRAPRFYVQAGRAWMHGGEMERAWPLLTEGRRIALASGTAPMLNPLLAQLQTELLGLGLSDQASRIAAWLPGQATVHSPMHPSPKRLPLLPLKCPSCGGGVLTAEVVWLDEVTAECSYCGSPLRGE
jgi:hypothetical protein